MSLFSIAVLVLLFGPASRQPGPDLGRHREPGQLSSAAARPARAARQSHASGKVVVTLVAGRAGGCFAGHDRRNPALPACDRADRGECRALDASRDRPRDDRAAAGRSRRVRRPEAAGSPPPVRATTASSFTRSSPAASWCRSREIELEGRPVALATLGDRFVVLETPTGDQRHVEPGWWETFDLDGNRIGGRNLAGYYPDDLAVTPDGKYLLLLSSGQAEGDPKKPLPALEVIDVDFQTRVQPRSWAGSLLTPPTIPADCRCRPRGDCAAVLLTKTNQTVAIDLVGPGAPRADRPDQAHGLGRPLCLVLPGYRLDHDAGRIAIRGHRDRVAAKRRGARSGTPTPRLLSR